MDPYTYVRNLSLGRRLEQASSLRAAEPANPFNLDPDLNLAIDLGFFIQPVLAERISRFSLVGVPENSPDQITAWAAAHKNCNWALALEDSGVLALEIEPTSRLTQSPGSPTARASNGSARCSSIRGVTTTRSWLGHNPNSATPAQPSRV